MPEGADRAAVLITGASRGIGLELTRCHAAAGHQVYATCRAPGRASELVALARDQQRIRVERLDAGQAEDIACAGQDWTDPVPRIIICNAASAQREPSFSDLAADHWIEAMRVNALSVALMAQQFVPRIRSLPGAALVAIGSTRGMLGDDGGPGKLTYRTSKAALNMMIRALAEELVPLGIRCFAVHPGWVRTGLGGDAAPLAADAVARDIAVLLRSPPKGIDGHLVDRFGAILV